MKMLSTEVPHRYRGVWRRTLLEADGVCDIDTTVFWLQTCGWHVDIRIPADRPDFSGVKSLADCSRAQLVWLAQQQGFAGMTQIDTLSRSGTWSEICRWHRLVDYRPPNAMPDAGYMQFEPTHLLETGVHADYLEHWVPLSESNNGFVVLHRIDEQQRQQFLMVSGDCVMHVRERSCPWPSVLPPDFEMTQLDNAALRDALDFEISFGVRTASGWSVRHSTLPWLECREVAIAMTRIDEASVNLNWNGASTFWQVLEWTPSC